MMRILVAKQRRYFIYRTGSIVQYVSGVLHPQFSDITKYRFTKAAFKAFLLLKFIQATCPAQLCKA